VQVALLA